MNLTIRNGNIAAFKLVQSRYIAAAGALAIAGSSLVATSPWHRTAAQLVAPGPVSSVGYSQTAAPRRTVIYLAGSRSEATQLEGAISSEMANYDLAGQAASVAVFVVDSPEKQILAAEAGRELMQLGVPLEIIDLRSP